MASNAQIFTLKVDFRGDMRRTRVNVSSFTFGALVDMCKQMYGPDLKDKDVTALTYQDDEGETITVSSNAELAEAFRIARAEQRKSLKMSVSSWCSQVDLPAGGAIACSSKFNKTKTNRMKPMNQDASSGVNAASILTAATVALAEADSKLTSFGNTAGKAADSVIDSVGAAVPQQVQAVASCVEKAVNSAVQTVSDVVGSVTGISSPTTSSAGDCKSSSGGESKNQTAKPSKPVPLRTTSGGAKLFLDGSVEFGAGGHAVLLPNGMVSCVMTGSGFPSVAAQGLLLKSGKWYYELTLLTAGCMQVGWATRDFLGDSEAGEGVGDDEHSWAVDGYRKLKWHNSKKTLWAQSWHAGDVLCCTLDVEKGEMCFVVNGQWCNGDDSVVAFTGVKNDRGFMPAASFSNGERLRFNFGAPGTPLAFGPPDASFKPVWDAFGTLCNEVGPLTSRPCLFGKKAAAFCNQAKLNYAKLDSQASQAAAKSLATFDAAAATITDLIAQAGVRNAITKALSHPEVSKFIQTVLVAAMKSRRAVEQALKKNLDKLVPVLVDLIAQCPQLLAIVPKLYEMMIRKGGSNCRNWRKHCHRQSANLNRMFSNFSHNTQNIAGEVLQWFSTVVGANTLNANSNQACNSATSAQDSKSQSLGEEFKFDDVDAPLQAAVNESLRVAFNSATNDHSAQKPAATDTAVPTLPSESNTAVLINNGALPVATSLQPKAHFIKESTSHNKKELLVNQHFNHTWRLVNNGMESWPAGVVAKRTTGDEMKGTSAIVPVAPALPGTSVDVTIDLITPSEPGRYISYWRLFNGEEPFGDRIWIDITVKKLPVDIGSDDDEVSAVEDLTDWVAVADSMRSSSSGISATDLAEPSESKSSQPAAEVDSSLKIVISEAKTSTSQDSATCATCAVKTGGDSDAVKPSAPPAVPAAVLTTAAVIAAAAATASTATAANDRDLDTKYAAQMKLMESMGFGSDRDLVLAILDSTNGNIGQAINHMIASGKP